MAVLGPGAFTSYARDVLPQVSEWRSNASNYSWPGMCCKLFDPGKKGPPVEPIAFAPLVATGLVVAGGVAILFLLGRSILRARSQNERATWPFP